jgi:hypothetical protein
MRPEQSDPVDKKAGYRLHVPSQGADAEKQRHLRFGDMKIVLEQTSYR